MSQSIPCTSLYSGLRSQMCYCWTNNPWRLMFVCVCVCVCIHKVSQQIILCPFIHVFNSSIVFCMLPYSCLSFRMCIVKADFGLSFNVFGARQIWFLDFYLFVLCTMNCRFCMLIYKFHCFWICLVFLVCFITCYIRCW